MIFFRNKKKYFFITLSVFITIYLFLSIFSSVSTFNVSSEKSSLDPSIINLEYEENNIDSKNKTISTWWIPNNNNKTMLVLHGLRSQKNDEKILKFIKEFHDLGFSIIAIDFRNHGQSSKGDFTFGVDEINDVYDTLDYYYINKDVKKVGIWGFSYGATTANLAGLNYDSKVLNTEIVGIFSDTPYYSLTDLISSQISRRTPLNQFLSNLLKPGILIFTQLFYGFDFNSIEKNYNSKLGINIPTKIIGCTGDQTVPIDQTIRANKSLGKNSSLVEFEKCFEHGDAFESDQSKYLEEFNELFIDFQSKSINQNNTNDFEKLISDYENYSYINSNDFILERIDLDIKFNNPWALKFIDDDQLIISEKNGRLSYINLDEKISKEIIHKIPSVQIGQGGLLDLEIYEDYLYVSFSKEKDKKFTTAIGRGKLSNDYRKLSDFEILFEAIPYYSDTVHFGSRMIINDGYLYASIGERGKGSVGQELDSHAGTIVRINIDGSIPNNPFSSKTELKEIYMIGVRNPQGMAIDNMKNLYISNHGAKGGDFVGIIESGGNYGWNEIGWGGKNYSGSKIGNGKSFSNEFNLPLLSWVPSIAPSDLIFYKGNEFSDWNGDVLVTSLKFKLLIKLELQNGVISNKQIVFKDKIGRLRDIDINSEGEIFLITDEKNSSIWKLVSSKKN